MNLDKRFIGEECFWVRLWVLFLCFFLFMSFLSEDGFNAMGWSLTAAVFTIACIITFFEYLYKEDSVYLREQELEVVRFRKVKTYHYERIQHFSLVKKWRLARASSFFVLVQQEPRFKIQLADGDTLELFF